MTKQHAEMEPADQQECTAEQLEPRGAPRLAVPAWRLWSGTVLTLSVPLSAGFLFGAKEPWTRGVVFALMALAIIVTGVSRPLPKRAGIPLIGLLLWGLSGFLPQSWFTAPEWRVAMQEHLGISTGMTLSPQPWVTLVLAWRGFASALERVFRKSTGDF